MSTAYNRFEMKIASAMVGVMELWMALISAFGNGRDPLNRVLVERDLAEPWAVIMASLGAMVSIGSVWPSRKCRQMGLAGTAVFMFAAFGLVVQTKLVSMTEGIVLLMAFGALVLVGVDSVKGPPREGKTDAQGR